MPPSRHESIGAQTFTEATRASLSLTFLPGWSLPQAFVILRKAAGPRSSGARIQTPSDAKVLSVVQPEREVVLGASSPARRISLTRNAGGRSSVIRPDGRAAQPFMRQRKRRLGGPETADFVRPSKARW